jgi:hypothetical protein
MGLKCDRWERERLTEFWNETCRKMSTWKTKKRWENNVKMNIRETGREERR